MPQGAAAKMRITVPRCFQHVLLSNSHLCVCVCVFYPIFFHVLRFPGRPPKTEISSNKTHIYGVQFSVSYHLPRPFESKVKVKTARRRRVIYRYPLAAVPLSYFCLLL